MTGRHVTFRCGTVVANRQRQEVIHQIWVRLTRVRLDESSSFKVVCCCRTFSGKPLQTYPWSSPLGQVWLHRNWLFAGVLNVDLEVVLEIFSNTGKRANHRYVE